MATPERRAEAEPHQVASNRATSTSIGVGSTRWNQISTRDADDVVGDRDPRRDAEASTDVEQGRRDADDAVEEDLGHEPAQQIGRDGALLDARGAGATSTLGASWTCAETR